MNPNEPKDAPQAPEQDAPQPKMLQVVPEPALTWTCPHEGCGAASAAPGMPLIKGMMLGRSLRITCARCQNHVQLVPQEQPRIVVPNGPVPSNGAQPLNRAQRRARPVRRKG